MERPTASGRRPDPVLSGHHSPLDTRGKIDLMKALLTHLRELLARVVLVFILLVVALYFFGWILPGYGHWLFWKIILGGD